MYISIASFTLRSASRRVRPWETQPGNAGTVATKPLSLPARMRTVYFMAASYSTRGRESKDLAPTVAPACNRTPWFEEPGPPYPIAAQPLKLPELVTGEKAVPSVLFN